MDLSGVNWRKSSYSTSTGGNCLEVGMTWHKSSYSASTGGNCVEVGVGWRKSSYSGSNGGDCVEVARAVPAEVTVRDSKDPDGPVLAFSGAEWQAFTTRIKSGKLRLG